MNYTEQYKSPHWQKKRLEMLSGANYTCELCGDTETQLHVHHRFYRAGAKIWEYENYELAVLCEECHSMVHGKNPKFGPEEYLFMACFLSFFFDPNFGEPTEMKNFWPDALLTARWMAVTAASQAVFEEKVVFPDKYSPLHQKMARIILRSKIPAIIWERGTRDEPQIRYSIARNLVSGSARASIDREACQNGPGWALPLYTPDSWAVLSEYRDCVFEGAPVAQEYIHSCYCAGVLRLPKGLLNT